MKPFITALVIAALGLIWFSPASSNEEKYDKLIDSSIALIELYEQQKQSKSRSDKRKQQRKNKPDK